MNWRCVNDFFRYCKSEPIWERKPRGLSVRGAEYWGEGVCKLSPETCDKCQTLRESLKTKAESE